MRVLRSVYEFITGGSVVAPLGVALAIVAALALPFARAGAFVAIVACTFIASTYERVR